MKRNILIIVGIVLVVLVITRLCVFDIVKVPEGKCPRADGWAMVSRWAYGYRLPWKPTSRWSYDKAKKGDWVTYNQPNEKRSDAPDTTAIRVGHIVAVPGDTIWYNNQTGQVAMKANASKGFSHQLIVPAKGKALKITHDNIRFYAITIMLHEPVKASILGEELCVNGQLVHQYTFQNDYYWVTTDVANDTNDSRTFGFVPHATLIGKVL